MTFDRKYKKDSFYAYKAWLRDPAEAPFVHLCGKRYVDRVEDVTKVTVYSNLPEVELFANSKSLGKQTSDVHFFYFNVPNVGKTELVAVAGNCKDSGVINKVDKFNDAYRLVEKGAVLNWFDITAPEGYFSLNDKLSDIMLNPAGKAFFMQMMGSMSGGMMGGDRTPAEMMAQADGMMQMLGSFTVLRMTSLMGAAGVKMTKEQLLDLNAELNKIQK